MELVVTLLIFALLIVGIRKKVDLKALLLGETFLILLFLTVIKGSVLGDSTTGNSFLDCISYIGNYFSSNIGGTVLSIIIVSAYVEVMNVLDATNKLAQLIRIPMKKVKNHYAIIVIVMLITGFLRTCITSGPAAVLLVMATFYPVMISCGCTPVASCMAILIANALCWGPANPIALAASQLMSIEVNMTEWFVGVRLLIFVIFFAVMIIVYQITARINDRKEAFVVDQVQADQAEYTVPVLYAILPLLPLVFMLIFSPFLISTITIDINTACLLSLLITLIFVLVSSRELTSLVKIIQKFFDSFGDVLKSLGIVVLLAMMFATCLNSIGGMQIIAGVLTGLNIPPVLLILLICIFAGVINVVVGSFIGALSIAEPIAATVASATGLNAPLICFLVILACGAGCVCSPVNPMVLVLNKRVPAGKLIKNGVVAVWSGAIVAIIAGCLILG